MAIFNIDRKKKVSEAPSVFDQVKLFDDLNKWVTNQKEWVMIGSISPDELINNIFLIRSVERIIIRIGGSPFNPQEHREDGTLQQVVCVNFMPPWAQLPESHMSDWAPYVTSHVITHKIEGVISHLKTLK